MLVAQAGKALGTVSCRSSFVLKTDLIGVLGVLCVAAYSGRRCLHADNGVPPSYTPI